MPHKNAQIHHESVMWIFGGSKNSPHVFPQLEMEFSMFRSNLESIILSDSNQKMMFLNLCQTFFPHKENAQALISFGLGNFLGDIFPPFHENPGRIHDLNFPGVKNGYVSLLVAFVCLFTCFFSFATILFWENQLLTINPQAILIPTDLLDRGPCWIVFLRFMKLKP